MSGATRQSVERVLNAPADAVFAVLADPSRHPELDGSGTVLGLVSGGPITAAGQRFRMDMDRPGRSDYRSDNVVSVFEPGVAIGWMTADVGEPPVGYEWSFHLAPDGDGRTRVTHVYEWGDVTDPVYRPRFPQVSAAEMAETLARLATAVG